MSAVRFHAFWSINAPLERARLCGQLKRFRSAGLDGVVFHPRFYPNQPPYLCPEYLSIVSDTILYAKTLGLSFWIYDEDGWPSGTVGGELLRRYPDLAQSWAGLYRERPERCLAEFDHQGSRWYLGEHIGKGVDYLNPRLAPRFLELTHERYRAGLTPEAFEHVEAFFCDEPEFGLGHAFDSLPPDGAIPWTQDLEKHYAARHGESLQEHLCDLFFTTPHSARVRVRFWELLRDRFCNGFLKPLNAWCETHGKRFAAHIKGEEHPLFQVPMVGSCNAVFRSMNLPGIDALERYPGNDFYPRQLVSSARQFGDGRCMAEAFGGAGWGATPADLEAYLLWLGGNGITDFVMHLAQYRLDSAAIRDWPPSQPLHLTWREAYSELLRCVRALLTLRSSVNADTLVVSPHRAIMTAYEPCELMGTNIHNAATYPDSVAAAINRKFLEGIAALQKSGAAWHVTDEATFETHARREGADWILGACQYRRVLVAEDADLPGEWGRLTAEQPTSLVSKVLPSEIPTAKRYDLQWSLDASPVNSLLLEPVPLGGAWFTCKVPEIPAGIGAELVFADEIFELYVADEKVTLSMASDGTRATMPKNLLGPSLIRFRCARETRAPYGWLEGLFRVHSEKPYVSSPNGTVTAGPFFLTSERSDLSPDLLAAGFPFLKNPIELSATLEVSENMTGMKWVGVAADAARILVDGVNYGWLWGPDWRLPIPLPGGTRKITLKLIPSTFNHFGPHHYCFGDRHVISPDQFSGKRNFADPIGAPACTQVPDWHFVPFRMPETVLALRETEA